MAEFRFDQVTPGAGTAGQSRHDCVAGEVISLVATLPAPGTGVTHTWEILDKVGSVASLTATTGTTVDIGSAGGQVTEPCSFLVKLIGNDNGTITETTRVVSVRGVSTGLRTPLFPETAPTTGTLSANDPDLSTDNSVYSDRAGLGSSGQNWRGWAEWAWEIVEYLENTAGGGPTGSASGDLSGTYPAPTVTGIQTVDVHTTTPTDGQVLAYVLSNLRYEPTTLTAAPTGAASGDLAGTYPSPSVDGLQGIAVSATTPTNGQVLTYNSGGGEWEPQTGGATPDFQVTYDADPAVILTAANPITLTTTAVGQDGVTVTDGTNTLTLRGDRIVTKRLDANLAAPTIDTVGDGLVFTTQLGGPAAASGGGAGGAINLTAANGGNGAGPFLGGDGGAVSITAGGGGAPGSGNGGVGGDITFTAGLGDSAPDGDIYFVVGGVSRTLTAAGTENPAGSAAAPSYTFTSDPLSGVYSPTTGKVAVTTDGAPRLTVDGLLNDSGAYVEPAVSITPTINQSAGMGYDGLVIDVTEATVGTGTKNILNAKVGGVTQASIGNTGTLTASGSLVHVSANEIAYDFAPVVNKSAGNFTALKINATLTAAPGTNYLADLQVASSSVFSVDDSGDLVAAGTISASAGTSALPSLTFATETSTGMSLPSTGVLEFSTLTSTSATIEGVLIAATGDQTSYSITPTVNKATSGDYIALEVDVTETSAPGDNNKLLALKTGGTLQWGIDSFGDIIGTTWHEYARVATTVTGTLATAYANGQTVDAVVLATGNYVLLKNQGTGAENGLYRVEASGAPTRVGSMATGSGAAAAMIRVSEGTANANTGWVCTNNAGADVVDTHALVFVSSGGAGADPLQLSDGSAGTPTFSYASQTDTGSYLNNTTIPTWGLSVEGADALLVTRLLDEATGDEIAFDFSPTVNKATSGNYTALKLNVTATAAPGAANKLVELQVSTGTMFSVDDVGAVVAGGSVTSANFITTTGDARVSFGLAGTPSHTFNSRTDQGMYSVGTGTLGFSTDGALKYAIQGALNASSGIEVANSFTPTLNQSGTAGWTLMDVAASFSQEGSGLKKLLDLRVAGVSRYTIDGAGLVTAGATQWKAAVRVATTVTGALATAYENGDTVDGVVLATGNYLLLKNQSTGSENGLYVVNATGAPTRRGDLPSNSLASNMVVRVTAGTANGSTEWACTNASAADTVGTHALVFAATGGGSGDVTAAASLTDNRLMRGDTTTKGIQDSGISVSDTDALTNVLSIVTGAGTVGTTAVSVGAASTGLYRPAASQLGLAANSEAVIVDNDDTVPSLRPDVTSVWDLGEEAFAWNDVNANTFSLVTGGSVEYTLNGNGLQYTGGMTSFLFGQLSPAAGVDSTKLEFLAGQGGAFSGAAGRPGGAFDLFGGLGGTGDATYVPGVGGLTRVRGGDAGAIGAGTTGASGGDLQLDPGIGNGENSNGSILIGTIQVPTAITSGAAPWDHGGNFAYNPDHVQSSAATLSVDGDENGKEVYCTHATNCTVTVDQAAKGVRMKFTAEHATGTITFAAGSGVTLSRPATFTLVSNEQYSSMYLTWKSTTLVYLEGDLGLV